MKQAPQRDTHTPVFTAASFTVNKIWKQLKCPEEWAYKENVLLLSLYLWISVPVYKERNITLVETWMNLEDIMLTDIGQTQTDKYCMTLLLCET